VCEGEGTRPSGPAFGCERSYLSMPSTVNGIGTTYYGKKNLHTRTGVCEHCKRPVELRSYETRLWFVVFFIPAIPLGRYQILDQCPACAWHRAARIGEWERTRERAIQEAGERLAEDPRNPQAAMELHGALVGFQRVDEAARLAEVMGAEFAENAGVQFCLGGWHEEEKRPAEADACFERALALEPENRSFRSAVAIGWIRKGELAPARELLSFMETTEQEREPAILRLLADAYEARHEHGDALHFYQLAMGAAPGLAQDERFRKQVAVAEKALGGPETILPKAPRRLGRRLVLAAVPVGALAIAIIWNYYAASHQKLHIVNGLRVGVTVSVDGGGGIGVGAKSHTMATVGEGRHRAVIGKEHGDEESVAFEVANSLEQRIRGDSAFVLNVAGAATLVREEAVYSARPQAGGVAPRRFYFGEPFMTFHGIDYAFGEFPKSVRSKSGPTRKTRLFVAEAEPAVLFELFPAETPVERRMAFAEHQLRLNPEDEGLLSHYYVVGAGEGRLERCREFLEKGVLSQAASVAWHRRYQDACRLTGQGAKLLPLYGKMLAERPGDSGLLYLKGRLLPRISQSLPLYEQAIAAERTNAYPWLAKGYCLASRGGFAEARKCLAEAQRLKPGLRELGPILLDVRVALMEFAPLEGELRDELRRAPLSPSSQVSLLRVLVAGGKIDEARKAHEEYTRVARATAPRVAEELAAQSLIALCYLTDEMSLFATAAGAMRDRMPGQSLVAQFELGRLEEVEKLLAADRGLTIRHLPLLLSLAWQQKGEASKARSWLRKAIETLAGGTDEERMMADLLGKGESLSPGEVDDVLAPLDVKAVLLAVLAQTCPTRRAELLARAEQLNIFGYFPYRFLERIIDEMKR